MISSLWNGLSGIVTQEKAINTEANNSANVNTVGHKGDQINFQDLLYEGKKGNGVNVDNVSKKFNQGTVTPTNSTFDIAIEGDGYFVVKNVKKNDTYYTRAGNFLKGVDGFLQNPDGLRVLGTTVKKNEIISSDPNLKMFDRSYDKFISSTAIINKNFLQTINSSTTDYRLTAKDTGKSGKGFKSRSTIMTDVVSLLADYKAKMELYEGDSVAPYKKSTKQIKKYTFSQITNGLTNDKNVLRITINNKEIIHNFNKNDDPKIALNKFADKISEEVGIKAVTDDKGSITIETLIPGKVDFITYVSMNSDNALEEVIQSASLGSGKGLADSSREALKEGLELAGAKFLEVTSTISINKKEKVDLSEIQLNPKKLNLYNSEIGKISLENGGGIYIKDGKNKFLIGKIESVFFRDDNGLDAIGDTLYQKTEISGEARNAILINKLMGSSLEKSNVNLSNTLVNLMTYQKAFEASSKSITTADELLKTAINLRK